MSSSSSAAGVKRTRSLRQPTAGLGSLLKKDDATSDGAKKAPETKNKAAVSSASSSRIDTHRDTSPSKLPKPGAAITAAARARAGPPGAGNSTATASAAGTRSGPKSGLFGLNRPNPATARQPPTESLVKDGAESSKSIRRIPTTSTRLTRPKSMIGPSQSLPSSAGSSSSTPASLTSPSTAKPRSPRSTAHTRAKSTAASLASTTSLRSPRPPSAGSAASASKTATKTTAVNKRPLGGASTVNTHAAPQRQVSASSVANTSAISAASSTTVTRPSKQKVTDDAPRLKPAFNTLQQHYSPARNLAPKPLTSSYLAPPTPSKLPANVALSSETAKLQTELLQLHLLHRNADTVSASWHANARERLGRRFEELAQASAEADKEEVAVEQARNLAALKSWASHGRGKSLDDKIQTLDGLLTGLWILSEPGGRYARVVRKFEKWVAQMMTAVEARRQAGGLGALMESGEVAFISELDPAWNEEVSSLARKLDEWRRHLALLEDGFPVQADENLHKSSLAMILAGCRSQVVDMLAELDTMNEIEHSAFKHEAAWIKRTNREDAADDTLGAGAIWRAF